MLEDALLLGPLTLLLNVSALDARLYAVLCKGLAGETRWRDATMGIVSIPIIRGGHQRSVSFLTKRLVYFTIDVNSFHSTIATIDDVCRGADLGEGQFWPSYDLPAVIPAIPIRMFTIGRALYTSKYVLRGTHLTFVQMTETHLLWQHAPGGDMMQFGKTCLSI